MTFQPKKQKPETEAVIFYCPHAFKQQLKTTAKSRGLTLTMLCIQALEYALNRMDES